VPADWPPTDERPQAFAGSPGPELRLGREPAISTLLGTNERDSFVTTFIVNESTFRKDLQGEQHVVVPVTGIVQLDEVAGDQPAG